MIRILALSAVIAAQPCDGGRQKTSDPAEFLLGRCRAHIGMTESELRKAVAEAGYRQEMLSVGSQHLTLDAEMKSDSADSFTVRLNRAGTIIGWTSELKKGDYAAELAAARKAYGEPAEQEDIEVLGAHIMTSRWLISGGKYEYSVTLDVNDGSVSRQVLDAAAWAAFCAELSR